MMTVRAQKMMTCKMGSKSNVAPNALETLLMIAVPAEETIPMKMIMEIPLPTPYSVMRSPSHIVIDAPDV